MISASRSVRFLLMAVAIGMVGCGKNDRPLAASKPDLVARVVRVEHVELRQMEQTIPATGTLAAQESATLSTKVSGRIERLEVDIGSVVSAGDLIAQIEPRDYELRVQQSAAALAEARAAVGLAPDVDADQVDPEAISSVRQARAVLEEAVKNLERTQRLTQSRIASASELDSVEAAHKVALTRHAAAVEDARARLAALAQRQAEFEIARKQLADSSVRAPFAGAIQARRASMGEFVSAGTPIAMLVKTDPLRLRLEVPERESLLVRAGQTVRLKVQGDTNTFLGEIARLSPALDETNRMLLVEADVPNPGPLRAGLFARAEIVINEHDERLSVPALALITFAGIEKVVTIKDGKALERNVTTGRRGPGWVEILSGLEAGVPVILEPAGLRSGQPVTVTNTTEPAQTSRLHSQLMADR